MSGRSVSIALSPFPPGTVVSRIPDEIIQAPIAEGVRADGDLAPVPEDPTVLESVPIWSRRATSLSSVPVVAAVAAT